MKEFSGWLLLIAMSVTAVFAQGAVRSTEATDNNAYWGQEGKNGYNQTVTDLPLAIVTDSLKEKWSMDYVSAMQAVVAGDYLYCIWSYGNREVRKVDIATGGVEETQNLWSEGDLVYGDGKIFITQRGYSWCGVLALDAETLDTLWVAQCETNNAYGTDNPWVYAEGYIYGGFSGHYYCFSTADPDPDRNDETIKPVWHKSTTQKYDVYEGILATIVGDDIYIGEANKMLRLNRKTGEELGVLTLTNDANIYGGSCYDAASGRLLFKDANHNLCSIKVGENGFDMDSKKVVNINRISWNNYSAPTVYNGRVYATVEKTLEVLDVETLEQYYSYSLGQYTNDGTTFYDNTAESKPLISTAFATDENNHTVYIYLQSKKDALICLKDFEGNTEAQEIYRVETQYVQSIYRLLMDQNGTVYCLNNNSIKAYRSGFAATGLHIDADAAIELNVGVTQTLTIVKEPLFATTPLELTWTSSNEAVATVSEAGLVTALAEGETQITVTSGDFSNTVKVTVQTVAVTGVTLDKTSAELTVGGEALQLTATVLPAEATDKTVAWTSSNEAVATVSVSGLVTAVAAGEADIMVTTTDGGFTAVCKLTVKAASVPDDPNTPDDPTVAVTGVTLDKTSAELTVGDEALQLTATVLPVEATDKTVAWTSSNEAV
ncbi:MAG: Ig-like domain-containing protein, partial [Bacteroidales bacterium]|nr:Ig-like domain-containing protein [Bacteroidales bacterium]